MKTKQVIIYRKVKGNSIGNICVPKSLIGQEVKITFVSKLTEKEKMELELNKLRSELKEIRRKNEK